MSKHSNARAKSQQGPGALLKQTPIFVTCSSTYRPLFDLFMHSVKQCKLDEGQVKPLLYDFPDLSPNAPTSYRTPPWHQAQRNKFAYFRDRLAELAPKQIGIFSDVDVQFFPNLEHLEHILERVRTRPLDLAFAAQFGPMVNQGFFVAANTPGSRKLLQHVAETLGQFGHPLHQGQDLLTKNEAEPVINRYLHSMAPGDLAWTLIPLGHVAFGPDTTQIQWKRVFLHHAVAASGCPAKKEQLGRVRHIYYNWKYADANEFPTTDRPDALSLMPRTPGGVWVTKSDGRMLTRDDGGIETRNPSVIKLLGAVDERHRDLPEFAPVYVCTQDTPTARVPGLKMLAFSIDKRHPRTEFGQEVIAVPDNTFDHWRNAGMPDYEETCAQIRAAGARPPHKNLAGWIGNAHMHPTRVKLLQLAHNHPAEVEAINTGVWKQVPNLPRFEVGQGRYYSLPEQTAMYAFFLDVEGNGWSGRLKLLLHSGRPVLIQDRPWQEFYFTLLKPMEHYVPVAADMSDLAAQVQWLQGNPEEADRIGRNAQAFAAQHLTREAALNTWARILREL